MKPSNRQKSLIRCIILIAIICTFQPTTLPGQAGSAAGTETIVINTQATAHPFPHFWERMFGSGRAILSLRQSYRQDLRDVRQITGFDYIRFHAILDDEVGVYDEDDKGNPVYNFSYVDQI